MIIPITIAHVYSTTEFWSLKFGTAGVGVAAGVGDRGNRKSGERESTILFDPLAKVHLSTGLVRVPLGKHKLCADRGSMLREVI